MPPTDPGSPGTRTAPLDDEAAVVARAAAGDRTAFAQLMEHYQSACYGLAWRLLGDADQAADATQDAFVHAYHAIAQFRGGVFRAWLLRITANASYDILRRLQRRPTTELPDPEEGQAELPDMGAPNPVTQRVFGYRDGVPVELVWWPRDRAEAQVDSLLAGDMPSTRLSMSHSHATSSGLLMSRGFRSIPARHTTRGS